MALEKTQMGVWRHPMERIFNVICGRQQIRVPMLSMSPVGKEFKFNGGKNIDHVAINMLLHPHAT